MANDAKAVAFDSVSIFGKPAIFADIRIDRESVPDGYHIYDLRHGDDWDKPCTLENHVAVNYFGTVIVNRPIPLGKDGYRTIRGKDFKKTERGMVALVEYMKEHPPHRKEMER